MADAKYFASFYGGLYYGTQRDYEKEYQKLMESGNYEKQITYHQDGNAQKSIENGTII